MLFVLFYISDGKSLRIPSLINRCHAPGPILLPVNNSVESCVSRKLAILKGWQSSQQTLLTPKILQMLSTYYWTWSHNLRKRQTTSKTTKLTFFFLVLLTAHPNIMSLFLTNLMHTFFMLIHLLHSSTCFEHYCAHLQEDNCINTAYGIATLFGWLFSTKLREFSRTRCCVNTTVLLKMSTIVLETCTEM